MRINLIVTAWKGNGPAKTQAQVHAQLINVLNGKEITVDGTPYTVVRVSKG